MVTYDKTDNMRGPTTRFLNSTLSLGYIVNSMTDVCFAVSPVAETTSFILG